MTIQGVDTRKQFAGFNVQHETIQESWERYKQIEKGKIVCPFERRINSERVCELGGCRFPPYGISECESYREYLEEL